MRYAGLIKNDVANGINVCVTLFVQGCPLHCKGCHNRGSWDFQGGQEFTNEVQEEILSAITANGVQRNLCIMGGEPMCDANAPDVLAFIQKVKEKYPNILIFLWTGYTYENFIKENNQTKLKILSLIDYLIDGPFILEQRDVTLPMRGSRNQRILKLDKDKKI